MRISTIIPAFNRAELIGATLESVLGQARAPDEVIVVDDGSSDGTADVIRGFGPAVTLITQQNAGAAAARNAGFARSSGDAIHFMDSDDLVSPNSYAVQSAMVETGSDIVFGPWLRTRIDGRVLTPEPVVVQQAPVGGRTAIDKLVVTGSWVSVFQPCMFRRSLVEAAGPYCAELKTAEDTELLYRLTRLAKRIDHSPETLLLYRVHPEQQLSEQNRAGRAIDFATLWAIFQGYIEQRDDLGWAERISARYRSRKAAREVRPYSPSLADQLESTMTVVDRATGPLRALAERVITKARFIALGHRYASLYRAGRITEGQCEQIALMGYALAGRTI